MGSCALGDPPSLRERQLCHNSPPAPPHSSPRTPAPPHHSELALRQKLKAEKPGAQVRLGRQARGPSSGDVVSRTKPVGSGVCFISVRGETPVPSSSAPHHPPASGWLVGRLFFSPSRTGSSSGAPDDVLGRGGGGQDMHPRTMLDT